MPAAPVTAPTGIEDMTHRLISSVAKTIVSTHCIYPERDAERAKVARMHTGILGLPKITNPGTNQARCTLTWLI